MTRRFASPWSLVLAGVLLGQAAYAADAAVQELDVQFARQVDRRLELPLSDQGRYIGLVQQALAQAGLHMLQAQTVLVADRNPFIQAAFLLLLTGSGDWHWVGATAVSTGKPGSFDHFITPRGVFLHSPDNPDYRAAGTYNENHIRGYGVRNMRVFDFGWQIAERGWGDGGSSPMRLAAHATDPERLGAPAGHQVHIREVRLAAGTGFVVAICGEILSMPGLPRHPAAERIGLDEAGEIVGLF